jgi:hypothetical protein
LGFRANEEDKPRRLSARRPGGPPHIVFRDEALSMRVEWITTDD